MRGYILLRRAEKEKLFKWLTQLPYPGFLPCGNGRYNDEDVYCFRGGRKIFHNLFCDDNSSAKANGFEGWRAEWEAQICKECAKRAKVEYEAGRRELWKFLPTAFGLGKWKDLVDFV